MTDEEKDMGCDIRADMRTAAEVLVDALELSRLFPGFIDNAKKFAGSAEISQAFDANRGVLVPVARRMFRLRKSRVTLMSLTYC